MFDSMVFEVCKCLLSGMNELYIFISNRVRLENLARKEARVTKANR